MVDYLNSIIFFAQIDQLINEVPDDILKKM